VKIETLWSCRPFADVTWQLGKFMMRHPGLVGPNLIEKDGKLTVCDGPMPSAPRVACPAKRFHSLNGHHYHFENDGVGEEEELPEDNIDLMEDVLQPLPQFGGRADYFEDDDEKYALHFIRVKYKT